MAESKEEGEAGADMQDYERYLAHYYSAWWNYSQNQSGSAAQLPHSVDSAPITSPVSATTSAPVTADPVVTTSVSPATPPTVSSTAVPVTAVSTPIMTTTVSSSNPAPAPTPAQQFQYAQYPWPPGFAPQQQWFHPPLQAWPMAWGAPQTPSQAGQVLANMVTDEWGRRPRRPCEMVASRIPSTAPRPCEVVLKPHGFKT